MKKSTIITLKIAVLECADAETVAEQVRKGIEFVNPVLQPEVVELSAEKIERQIFERGEV